MGGNPSEKRFEAEPLECYLHERVHVGTGIQEFLDDIGMSALARDKQRRSAIDRRAVNGRARLEQHLCDVEVAALRCEKQRCRPRLMSEKLRTRNRSLANVTHHSFGIDVSALLEQLQDATDMSSGRCQYQRRRGVL